MAIKFVRDSSRSLSCHSTCVISRRGICTTVARLSGHSRWSKIRHDKGKADATKSKERTLLSAELARVARDHGSDPMSNPRLATLIASAKKVGFAKDSIENAIARGSGKPKDGKALENLSIEVIVPPSVGAVIDCRTDNMARTMQEIRTIVKDSGARISPTKHLFERRGRLIVSKPKALGSGALFDIAVEAGATDVELGNEESPVLYTEPEAISEVSARLSDSEHSLQVESAEMVWHPLEDTMTDDPGGNVLSNLLYQFHEVLGVQEVFLNVR